MLHGYQIDQFKEVVARYLPEQPERVEQGSLFELETTRSQATELDRAVPPEALPGAMMIDTEPL